MQIEVAFRKFFLEIGTFWKLFVKRGRPAVTLSPLPSSCLEHRTSAGGWGATLWAMHVHTRTAVLVPTAHHSTISYVVRPLWSHLCCREADLIPDVYTPVCRNHRDLPYFVAVSWLIAYKAPQQPHNKHCWVPLSSLVLSTPRGTLASLPTLAFPAQGSSGVLGSPCYLHSKQEEKGINPSQKSSPRYEMAWVLFHWLNTTVLTPCIMYRHPNWHMFLKLVTVNYDDHSLPKLIRTIILLLCWSVISLLCHYSLQIQYWELADFFFPNSLWFDWIF